MEGEYINLNFWKVAMASLLIVASAALSLFLHLGLEKRLVIAAIRTVVQLTVLGILLRWIFDANQWYYVVALMAAMTAVAGWVAVQRIDWHYAGLLVDSVLAIWITSWCVASLGLFGVVAVDPWYRPQYAIPFLGMILHSTLNGISLGIDRFGSELAGKRTEVETLLALGATRWEAARDPIQGAVRTGMIPTINAMMVIGIVSIPGMMTGQLLAGIDPYQASLYQIVIMFLISTGSMLGTVAVVLLGYHRLFTSEHQFIPGRLIGRD